MKENELNIEIKQIESTTTV